MRIAVISDIHGNLLALEAVLADIKTRGVESTVNLGDCVTSPLWPRETYDLLQALQLPTVRGNHDRWIMAHARDRLSPAGQYAFDALLPEQRQTLGKLPAHIDLDGSILAVHGTPSDDSTYLLEEILDGRLVPAKRETVAARLGSHANASVVLCGHSHRQQIVQVSAGCMVLNPGSVGCPVFADSIAAPTLEHRSPHARYAVLTRRNGRWAAEFIALDYDWDQAAQRAQDNGFDNWATAIATGTVVNI
jgi:predicted phosphodiesterase